MSIQPPQDKLSAVPDAGHPTDAQIHDESKYYTGIDWGSLLFRLLEKIHWILLAAILCGVLCGVYVRAMVKPVYQAVSKLYIAGSETTISLSDLQLGSNLAKDYQEVFKIWHIYEMVEEKLDLNYSYSKMSGMVSVSNPDGTHLLYIKVNSHDPEEAMLMADAYAEVVQDFIANKMELRKPQLLEKAQYPTAPVSPDIKKSIVSGFAAGGFAAAALIVFLFLLDDKIRTSEDIEKATDLAVLGIITRQDLAGGAEAAGGSSDKTLPAGKGALSAVIHKNLALDFSGAEAVNMICSSIAFAGKNMKRIAVTSGEAGNGKTFTSMEVALAAAKRGKKVVLIDADLRKSVMREKYGIELRGGDKGLSHYLSGQCSLESVLYETNYANLTLLPVGKTVLTPLPLLTSEDFSLLIDTVAQRYDLILIDTPPIGMVIDSAEIAQKCDGIIIVTEYNHSTLRELRNIQKVMEQARCPVLGCVINKVTVSRLSQKRYYYRYGYSYSTDGEKRGKSKLRFPFKKER